LHREREKVEITILLSEPPPPTLR